MSANGASERPGAQPVCEITGEWGISHGDFFRILPRIEPSMHLLGPRTVEVQRADERRLIIEISPERTRRLATLRIPYCELSFRFTGWSESERDEFMDKFNLAFQKGGG